MNFSRLVSVLFARKKTIIITFSIIVLLTLLVNLFLPKSYTATTSLVVNYKGVDPVTGISMPAQLMPGYMTTQMEIITSHAVALRVVESLGLANSQVIKDQFYSSNQSNTKIEDWLADILLKNLIAKPSRESSIIEIGYVGADPVFAATISNAFAEAYQEANLRLKVEPSKKATDYLIVQAKLYRDKLEKAQAELSKYQQQHGLTSVVESLDVETSKLNQLASQLVLVQAQASDSSSRNKNATLTGDASPDIASNPVIQNLKISIAQASSKLAEISNRYGYNHPQYTSAQAELDKLKVQLQMEIQRISSSVEGTAKIFQQNEAQLKTALAAQKEKVLELNRSRDQLSVLLRDVETSQLAFNAVSQRLNQTNLEGKANESDISILNVAIPPSKNSGPRLVVNTVLSSVFGLLMGLMLAIFLEIRNPKIRSELDLIDLLNIQNLTVIDSFKRKLR